MTDIYTVIYTGHADGASESIPWILSFADLELAKNHVHEEAAFRRSDEESAATGNWVDEEVHSTYIQEYDPETRDTWTVVRTELVEANPSPELSAT